MKAQPVAARVRAGPQATFLTRLAVVLADPIRLRIVTELFRCEMSPSRFNRAFGGGSLSRVDGHFKRLAEHGWLRLVRRATGGRRRGSTEHFYRAPEPIVIDNETWAQLPHSVRTAYSWQTFQGFAVLVREALEAGTLDTMHGSHLTWIPLSLDEQGREQVIGAVDSLFFSLFEEQKDARVRIAREGEKPVRATVGLAAFDSLDRDRKRSGLLLPPGGGERAAEPKYLTSRVARVLGNPLNLRIVTELNMQVMSPSQFVKALDLASLSDVNRRFRMLSDSGWLVKVGEATGGRRRGAVEHFYRARRPAIRDTAGWSLASEEIRESPSWKVFGQLAERVTDAMEAGTFNARPDRHQSWVPLLLDRHGLTQVIDAVDALFDQLLEEERTARARLAKSGAESASVTVYLGVFRSPQGTRRIADAGLF